MEGDEFAQGRRGIRLAVDDGPAAVEQPGARIEQDRGEHRLLAGEVPVDGRAADAGGAADVFEGDAVEPALGEQSCGGGEQRAAPVGLRRLRAVVDVVMRPV